MLFGLCVELATMPAQASYYPQLVTSEQMAFRYSMFEGEVFDVGSRARDS